MNIFYNISFIQNKLYQLNQFYKLIEINFISFFKRFVYKNIYIYNLINYFLRYIYLYLIFKNDINNVIILFNHYL